MASARDILLVTGTSMEKKPGTMLGAMLSLMLGIIGLFFIYLSISQKGSSQGTMYFVAGIVFFLLAFIFNIGARSLVK
jgi:hypothetical protein